MKSGTPRERILVVDDSPSTLEMLQRILSAENYPVWIASSVPQAIEILNQNPVDLVITDLKMPGVGGLDLIRHVRENFRRTEIIMITGYPSIESAVQAVKSGAEEYLAKPFTEQELRSAVERAIEKLHRRWAAEGPHPETAVKTYGLIGQSEAMQEVFRSIAKAASSQATVLLLGESGTGKEMVARAIHYGSPRGSAPFVPVNCGAIPEALLESELFGHIKGAFTGAMESRAGFFQTADGGTIFLDEISETSPAMQVKLLRVLEEKKVCMVGSTRYHPVDVRIIAATNKDLVAQVKKGRFREDLFFRLNVLSIEIPPLRERGDDILLLIRHFVARYSKELGKPAPRFTEPALETLRSYHWPGNVRELQNVIQRLVVMTDGEWIEVADLPSLMRFSALRQTGFHRTLAEVEAEYIRNVLSSVRGNKTEAARILGIDRKTLREKLKASESSE
jgi:two-component system response regulator HydG